jgi:Glycosyl transferase family 11
MNVLQINHINPILTVRLSGGLGNQLFQLSAAQFVADLVDCRDIKLDCRFLNTYETPRSFELDFLMSEMPGFSKLVNPYSIEGLISQFRLAKLINRPIGKYALIGNSSSINNLLRIEKKSYQSYILDDYFQDPKYINIDRLQKFFKLAVSNGLRSINNKIPQINFKNSVGIHLRRGDFVHQPSASKKYATLDLNYYLEALKYFPQGSQYVIFGDEPEFIEEFSRHVPGTLIYKYSLSLSEEFILLSQIPNLVIANSTFSWWAASINWSREKKIISPKFWFKKKSDNLKNLLLKSEFVLLDNINF